MLPATYSEIEQVRAECRALVRRSASLSAAVSIVPVPGIDIGTDVAVLMRLLPKINEKFGLSQEEISRLDSETRQVVMMLISAAGSELIGRIITRELVFKLMKKAGVRLVTGSMTRFVPVFGQMVSAGISFTAMRALGNAHIEDCARIARQAMSPNDAAPSRVDSLS